MLDQGDAGRRRRVNLPDAAGRLNPPIPCKMLSSAPSTQAGALSAGVRFRRAGLGHRSRDRLVRARHGTGSNAGERIWFDPGNFLRGDIVRRAWWLAVFVQEIRVVSSAVLNSLAFGGPRGPALPVRSMIESQERGGREMAMNQAGVGLLVAAALVAMPWPLAHLAQPEKPEPKKSVSRGRRGLSSSGKKDSPRLVDLDAPNDPSRAARGTGGGPGVDTPAAPDGGGALGDICAIHSTACP